LSNPRITTSNANHPEKVNHVEIGRATDIFNKLLEPMWPAWRELPRTCCGFGEANSFHAWRTGERIKRQHLAPETERSNFAEFGFFPSFSIL